MANQNNHPTTIIEFRTWWQQHRGSAIQNYISGKTSFLLNLLPELAIQMETHQVLYLLDKKLGSQFLHQCLDYNQTIPSPVHQCIDGSWLKSANMVGINVRTIHNFWNVIKYTLTLPNSQTSIHLLPIWEPGVVSSLYGISSWNINPEFYSHELASAIPILNTVEKQLKAVINILHALGKTVGMDVIPHTDRYSEVALANPACFEWLQRKDMIITNHQNNLHEAVEEAIFQFIYKYGSATEGQTMPHTAKTFFSDAFSEEQRLLILFGQPYNYEQRQWRREQLVQWLYDLHFETVPATMGPPYRGIVVDEKDDAKTIDEKGRIWRDYRIAKPEKFSRVFGPLSRYKLYESKDDNVNWEIDFEKPLVKVWDYVCKHYANIQTKYNFDFMRGDMAHVQMRPEGVPKIADDYYDILKAIKLFIQKSVPYFGSFAETFLAPAGTMAYGDECEHLDRTEADSTLGDLQSIATHKAEFSIQFARYLDIQKHHSFAPNFTIITADKDDPRFDSFYLHGNEARFFIALFLNDLPSYMSLGFETRDPHPKPASNEYYTKLYVFQISSGEKATNGHYKWGENAALFHRLTRIRLFAEQILPNIQEQKTKWLLAPDPSGVRKIIAWTQTDTPKYIFVVNLDIKVTKNIKIPFSHNNIKTEFVALYPNNLIKIDIDKNYFEMDKLAANECWIGIINY